NDHQQRCLARPAGAHHGDRLAGPDLDIDAPQDLNRPGAAGQRQRHVAEGDDWLGHDRNSLPSEALPRALQVSTSIPPLGRHQEEGTHPMRKVPSKATLANMVFAFVLCNWLIAALDGSMGRAHADEPPASSCSATVWLRAWALSRLMPFPHSWSE